MSSNTVDYTDKKIDAGGDDAYNASAYGTTTGDLKEDSPASQGDFGSGKDTSPKVSNGGPGLRASGQDVANHEQWGKNSGSAGHTGGDGREKSGAPVGDKELTSDEARQVQGYSKTGDMNPEIGG